MRVSKNSMGMIVKIKMFKFTIQAFVDVNETCIARQEFDKSKVCIVTMWFDWMSEILFENVLSLQLREQNCVVSD